MNFSIPDWYSDYGTSKFPRRGAAVASTSVAGCGDDGDTVEAGNDGTPDGQDPSGTADTVDPTLTDLRHPEPQAVTTDDQRGGNGRHEFTVTVENTGSPGDIEMTLVLMDDPSASVWSPFADEAGTYQRFFSAGERRSETFRAELDSSHEGFGFRLLPGEAEVDVQNDGGAGAAEIRLLQQGGRGDGTVIESKTVDLADGESRTVPFTVDASFALEEDIDGIRLGAEVVPAS